MTVYAAPVWAQDTPVNIPKSELPKKAHCTVCSLAGSGEGEEAVAAGLRYKGVDYYFCSSGEVAKFRKDPLAFVPPVLPRPAPAFSLKSVDGRSIPLESMKGSVVLLDFWATWCRPCVEAMPDLQRLHEKLGGKGLKVVGISIDEKGIAAVEPWLAKRKFTYTMLLENHADATWKRFGVRGIPALFLVNSDGQIVKQWSGKPNAREVEAEVMKLLKSAP
jgi:peroxiredoxin